MLVFVLPLKEKNLYTVYVFVFFAMQLGHRYWLCNKGTTVKEVMWGGDFHSPLPLNVDNYHIQGISKNCSTFDKTLKNKDNINRLMER